MFRFTLFRPSATTIGRSACGATNWSRQPTSVRCGHYYGSCWSIILGLGKKLAELLPAPPRAWSASTVAFVAPPLVIWGFFCAGLVLSAGSEGDGSTMSGGESLLRSFPFLMMVAAVLLIVTGRRSIRPTESSCTQVF